jgi:hypothetical protein
MVLVVARLRAAKMSESTISPPLPPAPSDARAGSCRPRPRPGVRSAALGTMGRPHRTAARNMIRAVVGLNRNPTRVTIGGSSLTLRKKAAEKLIAQEPLRGSRGAGAYGELQLDLVVLKGCASFRLAVCPSSLYIVQIRHGFGI